MDEGVNRTSEFQISAKSNGEIIKTPFQGTDGKQVGKSLRGVLMPAVSGIDNRYSGFLRGNQWGAFLWMAHGAYVCIAGNHTDGIRNTFPFGSGAGVCTGKAKNASAQIQHGSLEAESCPGTGFIKAGCKFFALACMGIFAGILFNIICQCKQPVQFFHRQIQRAH